MFVIWTQQRGFAGYKTQKNKNTVSETQTCLHSAFFAQPNYVVAGPTSEARA